MPVNVDTIYQTVQALANKEQRGYLTPQEFNLFANQAQADIFEQYFYDMNAFYKQDGQQRTIGNSITHIQHKLQNMSSVTVDPYTDCTFSTPVWTLPTTQLTGRIHYTDASGNRRELRETPGNIEELLNLAGSRWHSVTDEVFMFEDSWGTFQVHDINGPIGTGVTCETVTGAPGLVQWAYMVVNERAIYDSNLSLDFGLHRSEQADLVASILKLAGISMDDSTLYQAGGQEESQNIQQENK
tara:strand:- start:552 stop:1277 length:726 start_codon:yes stop_codon:yes gene_type:complete